MKQIFGIKVGMVSLFDEKGKLHAGTVVKCEPNKVLELKGTEKHN
jgi:ribosomal protein L3